MGLTEFIFFVFSMEYYTEVTNMLEILYDNNVQSTENVSQLASPESSFVVRLIEKYLFLFIRENDTFTN